MTANTALTARMRRITLVCPDLADVRSRPAQDVELLLREQSGRRVKRRYTISAHRGVELDLDVLLHGAGAGARWGETAAPGDEVEFQGPRGKLELRDAPRHLLIGDESALPAIASVCAALPPDQPALAVVEVADGDDEQPVAAADVRWVHRDGTAPGGADLLSAALDEALASRPPSGTRAYLMGESRAMITLRTLVEDAGVAHEHVFVKGYWNVGRPDRLAGRAPGR